jgi:hypothetical protein
VLLLSALGWNGPTHVLVWAAAILAPIALVIYVCVRLGRGPDPKGCEAAGSGRAGPRGSWWITSAIIAAFIVAILMPLLMPGLGILFGIVIAGAALAYIFS